MSRDFTLHSFASAADVFSVKKQCGVSDAYGWQSGAMKERRGREEGEKMEEGGVRRE